MVTGMHGDHLEVCLPEALIMWSPVCMGIIWGFVCLRHGGEVRCQVR